MNLKRHLIVEGFGLKMQFLNKLLQWLFSLQVSLQKLNFIDDLFLDPLSNVYGSYVLDEMVWNLQTQRHDETNRSSAQYFIPERVLPDDFLAH
jgi:hypothetical protein